MTDRDDEQQQGDELDLELEELDLDDADSGEPEGDASAGEAGSSDDTAGADDALLLEGGALAAVETGVLGTDAGASEDAAATAGTSSVAEPGPAQGDPARHQGQWVWQFAAPPPPPPFLARFFSGAAAKDLYWFFAASLLVVLGCLMPWGTDAAVYTPQDVMEDGEVVGTVETLVGYDPAAIGVATPAGAIALVLGLYLLIASCRGIYTGKQAILPVFLMLEVAYVTWSRTTAAWTELAGEPLLTRVTDVFRIAGTGVMLAWIGSTIVSVMFLVTFGKAFRKDPSERSAARARSGGKGKKDKKDAGKGKGKKDDGGDETEGKDAGGDADKSDDGKGRKGRRGRRR